MDKINLISQDRNERWNVGDFAEYFNRFIMGMKILGLCFLIPVVLLLLACIVSIPMQIQIFFTGVDDSSWKKIGTFAFSLIINCVMIYVCFKAAFEVSRWSGFIGNKEKTDDILDK